MRKLFNKIFGFGRKRSGCFTARSGSVAGQLAELDANVADIADLASKLGLWIRDDDKIIGSQAPPVNSLSDAVEFVNERVLVVRDLLEDISDKLGAVL